MGLLRRVAVAAAAALLFAAPVQAASADGVADTPPPPPGPPSPSYQLLTTGSSILSPSLVTAADVDAFLARTPLAGMGSEFIAAEARTGINARFLVGITWTENNSGTSYLARTQHNLFSITSGSGGFVSYTSWAESIESAADYLTGYARPGGVYYRGGTIAAVGTVYATNPEWAARVARAANFIGPSSAGAYLGSLRVLSAAAGQVNVHVINAGYAPWNSQPDSQLRVHYRWSHRGSSVTGSISVPAPALRSGGAADLVLPGITAPAAGSGSWRLQLAGELAGTGWLADLGPDATDSMPINFGGDSSALPGALS